MNISVQLLCKLKMENQSQNGINTPNNFTGFNEDGTYAFNLTGMYSQGGASAQQNYSQGGATAQPSYS